MAGKRILGDDPFGAPPAGPDASPRQAKLKPSKAAAKPKPADKPAAKAPARAAPPAPRAAARPAPAPERAPVAEAPPAPERSAPSPAASAAHQPSSSGETAAATPPPSPVQERGTVEPLRPAGSQGLPYRFLWSRWRSLAMRDRSEVVDPFGRDPRVAARFDPLLDFLYRSYFRVSVSGLGHVPEEGRALIVSNHSGTIPYDGAMIMHAVRQEHAAAREVRPLVEDFVFHFPYVGTLMNRIGGVRACPENADRLLREEQLVAVFPEGIKGIGKVYGERYRLQRFGRGGFVKLALRADAPIIPTAVIGAEEIHPMLTKITWLAKSIGIPYVPITPTFPWLGPLGLIPLPSKWFIAFGEPLYYNAEYGAEGADDRILVNRLAEQVRRRIQEMIDELLSTRRSVLFG